MKHLDDESIERLSKAIMADCYDGLKPTMSKLSKDHCQFCAATVVGNGLLNTAIWYMCMPYAVKLDELTNPNSNDASVKQKLEELHDRITSSVANLLGPAFAHLGNRLRELEGRNEN